MRYSTSILAALAAAPLLVSARPVKSRAASANDALALQFANVLEQLETTFYTQGLAQFQQSDFTNAGFSSSLVATQILSGIQADESAHTTFLQQALTDNGATPLTCNYDFSSVLTNVQTMAATARVVEYLGVSAYLGAATLLEDQSIFLDAAASILTVEARHQSLLNVLAGATAIPQAFDIPFTPQEVLSIAAPFITGDCNTGVTPTNALTITNQETPTVGTLLTFSGNNVTGGQFCNMMLGGLPFAINLPIENCTVPAGVNGPVAIWITSNNTPLANNIVDRDTTHQVAGPVIAFIDDDSEALGQLIRPTSTSGSDTSTTTTILTPQQAASILASADSSSATGTPSDSSNSGSDSSDSDSSSTDTSSNATSTDTGSNGAAAVPASTPLPANFTGQSPDGKTNVIGLTSIPNPNPPADDAASASASASSSAASASASA
ncbi:hypothetical protein HMN09_00494100 [Mycena chlorophos]|uniref:Ferritin-like domain-containing protein n=1 Tax=Mycena chlorophos TaxID=658473 RepID=A0A8H6T9S4_MYCCL|nr:hypothetical protein HMN09_00494100 [Mycena chlorophos]